MMMKHRTGKRKFDVYLSKSLNLNKEEMGVETSSFNTLCTLYLYIFIYAAL